MKNSYLFRFMTFIVGLCLLLGSAGDLYAKCDSQSHFDGCGQKGPGHGYRDIPASFPSSTNYSSSSSSNNRPDYNNGYSNRYCYVCNEKKIVTCFLCKGLGVTKCKECDGKGFSYQLIQEPDVYKKVACSSCNGNTTKVCENCNGEKELKCVCTYRITPNPTSATSSTEKIAHHECVDLGLPSGLKWATCNLGAKKPEDAGWYIAWGETEPQKATTNPMGMYAWNYYKFGNYMTTGLSKYVTNKDNIKADSLIRLKIEDDAITANWGKKWRMPTAEEMKELIDNCTWVFVPSGDQNTVSHIVGTSKINGNQIIFPTAGFINYEHIYKQDGSIGFYWSSSLKKNSDKQAHCMSLGNNNINVVNHLDRFIGIQVRGVTSAKK